MVHLKYLTWLKLKIRELVIVTFFVGFLKGHQEKSAYINFLGCLKYEFMVDQQQEYDWERV